MAGWQNGQKRIYRFTYGSIDQAGGKGKIGAFLGSTKTIAFTFFHLPVQLVLLGMMLVQLLIVLLVVPLQLLIEMVLVLVLTLKIML
jgi:hypothetical protein